MTNTASRFKETKGPLCSGPFPFACEKRKQRFSSPVANQRTEARIVFRGIHAGYHWETAQRTSRAVPESSLLSSALASKDQGGSPDHASRLFALGSIREVGQM